MNIVMDFRKYDGIVGGVEQVVTQIISQIAPQGHIFIRLSKQRLLDEVKDLFKDIPNIKHIPLSVETHAISMKNAWHDSNTIQDIAESENAPVIHFPYNWSFPYKKKAKTILTIHDVIPFTFREAMPWFHNKFIYKPAIKRACKLNDVITTISEFSKQDIDAELETNGSLPWLQAYQQVAADYVPSLIIGNIWNYTDSWSDNDSFQDKGIPSFLVIENSWDDWDVANPYYHTYEDASDRLANGSPNGVTYDYAFATDVTRTSVALIAQEAVPVP